MTVAPLAALNFASIKLTKRSTAQNTDAADDLLALPMPALSATQPPPLPFTLNLPPVAPAPVAPALQPVLPLSAQNPITALLAVHMLVERPTSPAIPTAPAPVAPTPKVSANAETGAPTNTELAFAARLIPINSPGAEATAPPNIPAVVKTAGVEATSGGSGTTVAKPSPATDPVPPPAVNSKITSPAPVSPKTEEKPADNSSHKDSPHGGQQQAPPAPQPDIHLAPAAPAKNIETAAAPTPANPGPVETQAKPAAAPAPPLSRQIADTQLAPQAAQKSEPVRDISLRLPSQQDGSPVDLRLTERSGELHVAVRSSDPRLNSELRGNLSELAGKLQNSGYKTETWLPGSPAAGSSSGQTSDQQRRQQLVDWPAPQRRGSQPRWAAEIANSLSSSQS